MERITLNWWATSKQNFSVRIFSIKLRSGRRVKIIRIKLSHPVYDIREIEPIEWLAKGS